MINDLCKIIIIFHCLKNGLESGKLFIIIIYYKRESYLKLL